MSDDPIKGIQRFFGRVKNFFSTHTETPDALRYDIRDLPTFYQDRTETLRFVRETPLVYGYWGDFKRIFKQAETDGDRELLAALLARLDTVPFPKDRKMPPSPLDNIRQINGVSVDANGLYLATGNWSGKGGLRTINTANIAALNQSHKIELENLIGTAANERMVCALQAASYYPANQQWMVHAFRRDEAGPVQENVFPAVASGDASLYQATMFLRLSRMAARLRSMFLMRPI